MSSEHRNRSRAYPAINLREAIAVLRDFVAEVGWKQSHLRQEIIRRLGYAESSGAALRRIAALTHFGLLSRQAGRRHAGRYRPSELGRGVLEEQDAAMRRDALRRAFLSPKLFSEVVNRYRDAGAVPEDLAEALASDHGITHGAKDRVARIFIDSAQFASVLAADGVFSAEFLGRRQQGLALVGDRVPAISRRRVEDDEPMVVAGDMPMRTIELVLSGGLVKLELPRKLSSGDIKVLRSQVETLNAEVEADDLRGRMISFREPRQRRE